MLRIATGLVAIWLGASAFGQVVTLTPVADNTLYESPDMAVSNAVGPHVYCGKTNTNVLRRALMRFDVSAIPAGAMVTDVELRLYLNRGEGDGVRYQIHRVTSSWGQGTSNAGDPGGLGAAATPGDPTWTASFFGSQLWTTPGGDFEGEPSAEVVVGSSFATYSWSGPGVVADVQGWVGDGSSNFGWLLRGAEDTLGSALRWSSMEGENPPQLIVTYQAGSTCGTADYNGDGDVGTDQDIEAFFACLGGTCCDTCWHLGGDFNGDGDTGTDQDIESFFRVLGGGPC
ncbi:MAG TPA: DNRLRE domain-containing protein [Phycisphaerales bacterium]|nr:DNRLRE domain-containing protein [Phycisphaerales bacterium]